MNRQARDYGNKFRKPTKGTFTGKSTKTTAPTPDAPTKPAPKPTTLPSYEFADQQKGAVDTETEEKGKTDEKIAEASGSKEPIPAPIDKGKLKAPTATVEKNEPSTRPHTEAAPVPARPFQIFWNLETDNTFEEEFFTETNYWTPSALGLFSLLQASSTFVVDNRIRIKHDPSYLDYGVACYYAILFYIQILRAQMAAGVINGIDSSFLRRFERRYSFENLPIADFLVPYFSTIVSSLLPDLRHTWIVPQYGSTQNEADGQQSNSFLRYETAAGNWADQAFNTFESVDGTSLLQPIVPYMLAILRSAIDRTTATNYGATMATIYGGTETSTDYAFFNEDDEFVPLQFSSAEGSRRFNRAAMPAAIPAQNFGQFPRLLSSPGVNYPFHSDLDNLNVAWKIWNRSAYGKGLNVFAMNVTAPNTTKGESPTFKALEDFLLMPKRSNLDWFEELVKVASTHARYFEGVSNLTDIPTTGGQDPLITTEVKIMDGRTAQARARLDTLNINLSHGWDYNPFSNIAGSLRTTRATLEREEELQALTFATNASVPFVNINRAIADTDESIGAVTDRHLVGDYWKDKVFRNTSHAQHANSGKLLYKGWKVLIQNNFAKQRPSGY